MEDIVEEKVADRYILISRYQWVGQQLTTDATRLTTMGGEFTIPQRLLRWYGGC